MAGLSDDMNLRYFAQECCCSTEALLEDAYKVSRLSCTDGSRNCRRIDFLPTGCQHAGEADETREKSAVVDRISRWMLQKRWEGRAATSNMSSAGGIFREKGHARLLVEGLKQHDTSGRIAR